MHLFIILLNLKTRVTETEKKNLPSCGSFGKRLQWPELEQVEGRARSSIQVPLVQV